MLETTVVGEWLVSYDERACALVAVGPDCGTDMFAWNAALEPLEACVDDLILSVGLPLADVSDEWEDLGAGVEIEPAAAPGVARLVRYLGEPARSTAARSTAPIDASWL